MRIPSPVIPPACAVGLALGVVACTPYSFSGGRTALVSTIAIPLLENETAEYGLAEALTAGIIDGFVEDNQVKVVDAAVADATLVGRVTDYQRRAYTFDENDLVKDYIVEIWITAELVKRDGSETIWTLPNFRGYGIYPADSAEAFGQLQAIEKITVDIINQTIRSW